MPSGKKRRKAYEDETPESPDPGYNGAQFLGWIKKHGFSYDFGACEVYCNSVHLDIKRFINDMNVDEGPSRIYCARTGRTARGKTEVLVIIRDRKWASKWARKYKTDMPHHRGWVSLSDEVD